MCFMTFNDFWHISEMLGVVIGDDMWNLIASLALRAVAPYRAPWEREASSPPLCVPLQALFLGGTHGFALRAVSLRDDVSLFERITRPAPPMESH